MSVKEMITVLQAHLDKKPIEVRIRESENDYNGKWRECIYPGWDFCRHDYRVKPEPREWLMYQAHGTNQIQQVPPAHGYVTVRVREVIE